MLGVRDRKGGAGAGGKRSIKFLIHLLSTDIKNGLASGAAGNIIDISIKKLVRGCTRAVRTTSQGPSSVLRNGRF
jgi:hypothetical protein